MDPVTIVQGHVAAFNARDLDRFVSYFSVDAVLEDGNGQLRLPRLKPGGSDQLPLNHFVFRVQALHRSGACVPRAVSGGPSTGRATPSVLRWLRRCHHAGQSSD
jgi:hypothetical protein